MTTPPHGSTHADSAPLRGRTLALALGATAVFWLALALYRHHVFGSAMFDLGLFDQIVWNTAHGRLFHCSVHRVNFLGDHFGPAVALLAPVYRAVSSPDVLIAANALAVVAAALPLRAAVRARGGSARFELLFVAAFLAYPSATCIAVYDFHPDVMALPWLMAALYFESERRYGWMLVAAVGALVWKEEYAVWIATLGVFVAVTHGTRAARRVGAGLALFGVTYLLVVLKWVMPHFNPGGMEQLSRYAYLGHGVGGILHNLVTRPWVLFSQFTPIKLAHFVVAFAALAFLPLRAPARLALAIPVWGYSLTSTFENQAFLHYQNVVPLLPPLFFATLDALLPARQPLVLPRWLSPRAVPALLARRRTRWLVALAPANVVVALIAQWYLWGRRPAPAPSLVDRAVQALPAGASLSTTNALGAHFGERRGLVLYPRLVPLGTTRPVDAVLLPLGADGYRYSADSLQQYARELATTRRAGYEPVAIAGNVVLLERASEAGSPRAALEHQLDAMTRTLAAGLAVPRSRATAITRVARQDAP